MTRSPALAADEDGRDAWLDRALCRTNDPELWHDPASAGQARAVCDQCPVLRECAAATVRLADAGIRNSGVWAGEDIPEKIESSSYRHLIARLRFLAATGTHLPRRNTNRAVAV